ncbi:hypothetical protein [Nonomuraea jiangxiensis]|uniref:Uncharacterized protein n=1 Tax=Nonomuraea jiangxiensis TaxID=633440 RepID=A0A1G8XSU9_9ACTN|nr:hypothetical protein [Nonomuraea jiangxiensis]SDJ93669.1 hypothetical protein SAMN05421869_11366 [Nonomuraea jiangxiensis]
MPSKQPLDIPECTVRLDDNGVYHLTHESGRTASAATERGAMLCGMALRILAEHADPPPPGMRHHHISWPAHLDREIPFTTGDLP